MLNLYIYFMKKGGLGSFANKAVVSPILLVAMLLTAMLLASCGGATEEEEKKVPPQVVSITPADGATDVSVNTLITVTFDRVMKSSTLSPDNIHLKDGGNMVGLNTVSTESNSVTFAPNSQLNTSTPYTITVTTAVQDAGGVGLASPVEYTFTTSATATYLTFAVVEGLTGTGLQLQLTVNNSNYEYISVDANGTYSFDYDLVNNAAYEVIVANQPTDQYCSVTNGSGTIADSNAWVNVSCVDSTGLTHYNVSGTVSGLTGTLQLIDWNTSETLTITQDGPFAFSTDYEVGGMGYYVDVLSPPEGQSCTVSNGQGTSSVNVTNVTVTCVTSAFPVNVTVTGLVTGTVLQLVNNDNNLDVMTFTQDGTNSFAGLIGEGNPYSVTVWGQPTGPNQYCSVTDGSGLINQAAAEVTVTCVINTYTVSVYATGVVGSGLVVQNNLADDITIDTDGTYWFPYQDDGTDYAVTILSQPSSPGQTCTISGGATSGTFSGDDVYLTITCVTNAYTLSGSFVGLVGTVMVHLSADGQTREYIDVTDFSVPNIPDGTDYAFTVTQQPYQMFCEPTAFGSGTVSADITGIVITCKPTYLLEVTVEGLLGSGLVLQNNGADDISIVTNGTYSFPRVVEGDIYQVSALVQPTNPSQTCEGVIGGPSMSADVSGTFTCTTDTFTIGGSITGLSGTVELLNNGGDLLSVTDLTSFTFATALEDLSSYRVTVATHPTGQRCTVSNGTGALAGANVTNLTLDCVANIIPGANAGGDTTFNGGERVILDGTGSSDADAGDTLTYSWTQTVGTTVDLQDADTPHAVFTAPNEAGTLTFQLTVSDGAASSSDLVIITTEPWAGNAAVLGNFPLNNAVQYGTPTSNIEYLNGKAYLSSSFLNNAIYDVSDPNSTPVSLGTHGLKTLDSEVIEVSPGVIYSYMAPIETVSLLIQDVSDPANIGNVGSVTITDGTTVFANSLAVGGGYAYLATNSNGLRVVDVSTPSAPWEAGDQYIPNPIYAFKEVKLSGNYIFAACDDPTQGLFNFVVLDISGVTPTLVNAFPLDGVAGRSLAVSGNLVYVATATKIHIYDITDINNIVPRGTLGVGGNVGEVTVDGTKLYVANSDSNTNYGLQVIDVSDPDAPVLERTIKSRYLDGRVNGVKVSGGYAYADIYGIEVINLAMPEPSPHGSLALTKATGINVQGNRAYVAGGTSGVELVDISDPTAPVFVSNYNTPGVTYDVFPAGDKVYVADDSSGLLVLDYYDPLAPVLAGTYPNTNTFSVVVQGDTAFVGRWASVFSLNVADPGNITLNSPANSVGADAMDLFITGDKLLAATWFSSLNVLNISDPAVPVDAGVFSSTKGRGVAGSGNTAYYAAHTDGVKIVDITTTTPTLLGTYAKWGGAGSIKVAVQGPYIYVADSTTLEIVDVSDPTAPYQAGRMRRASGSFSDVSISGDFVYIATDTAGIQTMDVRPILTGQVATATASSTISYGLSWRDFQIAGDVNVKCFLEGVAGGSCTVTSIDQVTNTAAIDWTVPGTAGDYEIVIGVGDNNSYATVKDRVTVP